MKWPEVRRLDAALRGSLRVARIPRGAYSFTHGPLDDAPMIRVDDIPINTFRTARMEECRVAYDRVENVIYISPIWLRDEILSAWRWGLLDKEPS